MRRLHHLIGSPQSQLSDVLLHDKKCCSLRSFSDSAVRLQQHLDKIESPTTDLITGTLQACLFCTAFLHREVRHTFSFQCQGDAGNTEVSQKKWL